MRSWSILASFVICYAAAPARGEIVILKDGSRLVGEMASAKLSLITLDGPVKLDPLAIEKVLGGSWLKATADQRTLSINDLDSSGWHVAARMITQRGLWARAIEYADRALRAAAATGEELQLHGDLLDLPIGTNFRNDPLTPDSLATLLDACATSDSPARSVIARARLETKLAAFGEFVPLPLVSALGQNLTAKDPRTRVAALRAIAIAHPADLASRIAETLIADRDAAVRAAALETAVAYGRNQHILVRVLQELDKGEKARAAAMDVLERLADPHAVAALIRTLDGGGSGFAGFTSSMSVTNQVAYVSDFDVEVANAAFIADPTVSVAQEGATLEVTVYGSSERGRSRAERERIARLLERLTGARFGTDGKAWSTWLAARPASRSASSRK